MANRLKNHLTYPESILPLQYDLNEAAMDVLALHEAYGGATYSLYFGNQAGERLYSVSVFPDFSFVIEGKQISYAEIKAFLTANKELLANPRCCIGTWYSEEADQTYLDVTLVVPKKRSALSLGKRYNQEGIFDLYRMEYLPTGGSGEPPETMPSVEARLLE